MQNTRTIQVQNKSKKLDKIESVLDRSEGVNLLSVCCSSGTCRLWSFSWTTTRESRLKSMPVTTASRSASSWANLSWHGNTMHQRRCVPSAGQTKRVKNAFWRTVFTCQFSSPTDQREVVAVDRQEERYDWQVGGQMGVA